MIENSTHAWETVKKLIGNVLYGPKKLYKL